MNHDSLIAAYFNHWHYAFYLVIRFINKRVSGTANELKIKKSLKIISIIYGAAMAIQIVSLITRL